MNDIRAALAAAMQSQADIANEDTELGKSANDEQLQSNAAKSGRDVSRLGRRKGEQTHSGSHSGTAITAQAEAAGRRGNDQRKPEQVNREAPRNWTTSDKEAFEALPKSAQDFILRQCRSIETALGKKSERLAAFHREYEPVAKMLEPFAGRLKELDLTPRSAIQRYIDIERRLARGDGVAVIKALVDGYNVAPDRVIEALGAKLPDGHEPAGGADRAAALHDFESQIEQFKTTQDTDGNPLHPHYADVEPEMTAMALAYRSRGQTIPPLKELYERAVWTNPGLRGALVRPQQASRKTIADAESNSRTAAKKPALSPNTGESKRALTAQSPGRSLRDEILAHVGGA